MAKLEIRTFTTVNLLIFFALLCGLAVLSIFHYYYNYNFTLPLEVASVVISLYAIMAAKSRLRWFHSFVLFIGTFMLFNFSRYFFDLIGEYDLSMSDKYIWYRISDTTLTRSMLLLLVSLVSVNLGYYTYDYLHNNRFNTLQSLPAVTFDHESLSRVFVILLAIVTPGTILKLAYDLYFLKQNGFLALYTDMEQAPAVFRLSWFLFSLIFPILLIFRNKKSILLAAIIIYFLTTLLDAAKGTRNTLLRPLLALGWYYYTFYSKKDLSLSKVAIIGIGVLYFAFFAVVLREGSLLEGVRFSDVFTSFLTSQGVTFLVMVNYLDFQNQLIAPSPFYLLYPIQVFYLRFFTNIPDGHNHIYAASSWSLDHKLTYTINPDLYMSGVGFGSSYVVELYAMGGLFMVIFGSFFIGYFINKFECYFRQHPVSIIFGWYWINHLIWMSRSSFMPTLVMIILSYLIFYIVQNTLLRKKEMLPGLN